MTSDNGSWTPDGSEPKTAADEDDFKDVDQFGDGNKAQMSVTAHGDIAAAAAWLGFARRAFYKAHNEESISDIVAKRFTIHPDVGISISYNVQPGPYGANVFVEVHATIPDEPPPLPPEDYIPPSANIKEFGAAECHYILSEPGKRLFTEVLGHNVNDSSGGDGISTVVGKEDNLGDWQSCTAEDGTDREDHFGRPFVDVNLETPFFFAGKQIDKAWLGSDETISFSGPWLFGGGYGATTTNDVPCGLDYSSLRPEQRDNQLRVSLTSNQGETWCNMMPDFRILGTTGSALFPNIEVGGDDGITGIIRNRIDIGQLATEFGRNGVVSQEDLELVGGAEKHFESDGEPIGVQKAQVREFFAITTQYRASDIEDETGWDEGDIKAQMQVVLLPKTQTCPAAVGVFSNSLVDGADDAYYAGITGEPWCGVNSKYSEGNGPDNPDYDPHGSGNVNVNWPELGNQVITLSGNENDTMAWVHGRQSTEDGAGDRVNTINHDRCFWFTLNDEGFVVDAIAQTAHRNIDPDPLAGNYQTVFGDIGIVHPELGIVTV